MSVWRPRWAQYSPGRMVVRYCHPGLTRRSRPGRASSCKHDPVATELPAGLVTFLLTDIEGSTRLFRRLGDRWPPLLDLHNEALRTAVDEHGGVEFKSEGDALLVAFGSAAAAFEAAVDAQARLRVVEWPVDAVVKVRMGLHTGLAHPRDGDYIALALHQAARVVGAGHGGQVLASLDAVRAAGDPPGLRSARLGAYRLRDFDATAELFQVTAAGTSEETVPSPPGGRRRRPQLGPPGRQLRRARRRSGRARAAHRSGPPGHCVRARWDGKDAPGHRVRAACRRAMGRRCLDGRVGRDRAGSADRCGGRDGARRPGRRRGRQRHRGTPPNAPGARDPGQLRARRRHRPAGGAPGAVDLP